MCDAMRHRGPNDEGQTYIPHHDGKILGLGQRRLSILDLSAAGHQPMIDQDNNNQIIFNGEIYNFQHLRQELESVGQRFTGHSDTEVLLYGLGRWGADFLRRLAGMYALAFYDASRKQLLLARDPLGIKPLYYTQNDRGIFFASEVRAILASGMVAKKLNMQGVASYLAYGAVQQPATIVEGIESFAPGSWQIINADGRISPSIQYWRFPRPDQSITSEAEAIAALRSRIETSVQQHMIADVPVGVFLSSGLDSTIVAGLAAKYTNRLRTFTVGFSDQPDLSEIQGASATASIFGVEHTYISVNGDDAEAATFEWLNSLDQPSFDGLNVYVISKAIRRFDITVALSGQGGDELFGGYPSFSDVPRFHRWVKYMAWLPLSMRRLVAKFVTMRQNPSVRQKLSDILQTDGSTREIYFHRRRAMSNQQLLQLGISSRLFDLASSFHLPAAREYETAINHAPPIWQISQLESLYYQGNMLLRDSDTNGMAHSLEIRVPLLDQRVVDYVATIPDHIKLPSLHANKHLLRRAFPDLLRPDLLNMPKRGFTLPIRRWMHGPMRDACEMGLQQLKQVSIFEPSGIDAIWNQYLANPEGQIWSRAFMLVVLGLYIHKNFESQNMPAFSSAPQSQSIQAGSQ